MTPSSISAFFIQFVIEFSDIPKSFAICARGVSPLRATATTSRRNSSGYGFGMTAILQAATIGHHTSGVNRTLSSPLTENVMVWLRDGELHARYDDRVWIGRQGEVLWLPAGAVVEQVPRAAVSLSILCTDCVRLERPQRARFSRVRDEWLLWALASTSTLVRPAYHHGFHPRLEWPLHAHVIDAFETQVAVDRARSVPMPEHAAARAVATRFLQTLGTSAEAAHNDLAAEVRAAFQHDTGLSVTQWQLAARMRIARKLLHEGASASSVSSRVGYTMLSNFSRAFSRFHGIGPREFQALECADDRLLFA